MNNNMEPQRLSVLKVKIRMLELNLSSKDICNLLKISEPYLSVLINGRLALPKKSDSLVNRLASILKVSKKEILE